MSVGTRPGRTCAWSHTASSGGAGLRALSVAGSDTASAREKVTRGHVRQAAALVTFVFIAFFGLLLYKFSVIYNLFYIPEHLTVMRRTALHRCTSPHHPSPPSLSTIPPHHSVTFEHPEGT